MGREGGKRNNESRKLDPTRIKVGNRALYTGQKSQKAIQEKKVLGIIKNNSKKKSNE